MDFTVEGRNFRVMAVKAVVLGTAPTADTRGTVVSLGDSIGVALRMPRGEKGWQSAALQLEYGTEVQLPLPGTFAAAQGDSLVLGCLGPVEDVKNGSFGESVPLEVYAVRSTAPNGSGESMVQRYEFADAATVMKRCGLARANEYVVEKYPLKKVCKVSAIVFLVGLVCFSFLMHLFTESMDEFVRRLPDALNMSAKFGGVSALVVAVGGGLYMKSSNDYNRKKKLDSYIQQFGQAMSEALPQASA